MKQAREKKVGCVLHCRLDVNLHDALRILYHQEVLALLACNGERGIVNFRLS